MSYEVVVLHTLPRAPEVVQQTALFGDEQARWLILGCRSPAIHNHDDVSIIFDIACTGPRNTIASEIFENNYFGTVVVVPRKFTMLHFLQEAAGILSQ